MNVIKTKVCIIGSGIAGCLCAKFLARGIDDILIVERGARVTHDWRVKTRRHEQPIPTAEHNHIVKGKFKKNIQYVYAMGGTTNLWMGHSPRFLPGDFRVRTLYGITEDWLISYEELEHYYCLAEEEMAIAGADDNKRIPRSKSYPQLPHPFSPADLLVKRCFPEGDVVSLPQARPSSAIGNRPACCGSAVCDICPVDSKYTPMNAHIPELEKNPAIRFLSETVVLSLVSNGNRHVNRATAKAKDGSEIMIEAQTFVLAANAVENAAILLRSPTIKQNPYVGKYLFDHPVLSLTAQIKEDGFPNYGYSISTAFCYSFADGPFRSGRASSLALIRNSYPVSDFVRDVAMNHGLSGRDLHNKVLREFRNQISLTFMFEDVPNPDSFVRIGRNRSSLGLPQTEIYYNKYSSYVDRAHRDIAAGVEQFFAPLGPKGIVRHDPYFAGHLLGTCKIGKPENGVVDPNLRYHPYDNVFILGGSAFPTYSAANPTLTIAALAIRLGSYLSNG
ncbi:GMC family oxidoreductase [bacterium]|nr:GMC family oxidoreductase [bacterium]MCI0604252.1 GMC family oxidoreductase [bacterium]